MRRRFVPTIVILITMLLMGALTVAPVAAQSDRATVVYRLAMSGDEEVCAIPSRCGGEGTGEAIVIVNPNTDTVCMLARWRDVAGTVVAAHIHEAPDGVAGPVVVPLFPAGIMLGGEDKIRVCVDGLGLTDDINDEPAEYYVNIHSTAFPAGEIRGQLESGHHH
jgi:hypothetical protein